VVEFLGTICGHPLARILALLVKTAQSIAVMVAYQTVRHTSAASTVTTPAYGNLLMVKPSVAGLPNAKQVKSSRLRTVMVAQESFIALVSVIKGAM
jgi:hypothetical protein